MNSEIYYDIKEIIEQLGISPHSLKLEVTESMVMENAELALKILSDLCDFGIRISSDDFGTGYSSLSYLHRFPFHRLKIDRSFISKMDEDEKSEEIVRTIILLSKNLSLDVVAEGIETEKQLQRLVELGCHFGQGYLFSRPLTVEGIENFMLDGLNNIQTIDWSSKIDFFENPDTVQIVNVQ